MKNYIIEGARGVGKSSVTRKLRDKTTNSTLINFTGFNEHGKEGLEKVATYYHNWRNFFNGVMYEDMTFIHDRFYFSEMVYSQLYKDYDFSAEYGGLNVGFNRIFKDAKIILLTSSEETLEERLIRDKENLFGNVTESVENSIKQQSSYIKLFEELAFDNASVHIASTSHDSVDKIVADILAL